MLIQWCHDMENFGETKHTRLNDLLQVQPQFFVAFIYDHPDLTTPLLVITRVGGGEEEDPLLM